MSTLGPLHDTLQSGGCCALRSALLGHSFSNLHLHLQQSWNPHASEHVGTVLQDAEEAGCTVVSGVEMFVGQALQQFVLFTAGTDAPAGLFRQLVLEGLQH